MSWLDGWVSINLGNRRMGMLFISISDTKSRVSATILPQLSNSWAGK